MEQTSDNLKQQLEIFQREFLGRLLVDRLHFSLPVIEGIFISIYFGALLILHAIAGHPLPASLSEVFRLPTTFYYYPNLIGVVFDLAGNPSVFVLLLFFRYYIPQQFIQLGQDGLIQTKSTLSYGSQVIHFVISNQWIQIIAINVLPITIGILLGVLDFRVYQPVDIAAKYAIFLSIIGIYANMVLIIEISYIFLILNSYTFKAKLNLLHPDQCSGLAPFGNLAIAIYTTFFVWAMIAAIGISAGGSAWQKVITSVSGPGTLIYLWILFPLAILIIFNRLIYQPHYAMRELQREYLLTNSRAWTGYHQSIQSSLVASTKKGNRSTANKSRDKRSEELEQLETWAKLDSYIANMHIWPISTSTVRLVAVFVNPILPIAIPALTELVLKRLP